MLYQEVRPSNLSEVHGNKSTIRSLESLARRDPKDRPHTILLSGPKGCGKTSIARILATLFGTSSNGLTEVDAADVRGIEGVRTIIEQLPFKPIGGGSCTYIWDEVHRLTKDAQSALLKSAEEPPEHAYLILCTTDPQLLLPTLKNRCTEYKVEKLKSKDIVSILEDACKKKNLTIDKDILEVIATNCDRTPRTALVMLEKIQDIKDPDELADAIVSEIENEEKGEFFDLCKMLLLKPEKRRMEWQKILAEYEKLDQEPEGIRQGILSFMRKQLRKIDSTDMEYALDIVRTMRILAVGLYHGGKHYLPALLVQICLGEDR